MNKKKTEEITPEDLPDTDFAEEKTGTFVTLRCGATFRIGEYIFKKGETVPIDSTIAQKLNKTGFFEVM